jgi:hypothetical protein
MTYDPGHERLTLVAERERGLLEVASLRAAIELYFDVPFDDIADSFLEVFDDSWTWLGRRSFGYWRNEAMTSFFPMRRHTPTSLHQVLRRALPKDVGSFVAKRVDPACTPDDASDRVADAAIGATWFSGRGTYAGTFAGEFRLVDVKERMAADPTAWLDRVLWICDTLPAKSGVAGFAAERAGLSAEEMSALYAAVMRHPGVDLYNYWNMAMAQPNVIKGVNWLTVLSHAAAEQLGSPAQLRDTLDGSITIHQTRHAVVLQAGATPRIGDVNRGDLLDEYRNVYRTVRPLHEPMIEAAAPFPMGHDDDDQRTEAWLRRFED